MLRAWLIESSISEISLAINSHFFLEMFFDSFHFSRDNEQHPCFSLSSISLKFGMKSLTSLASFWSFCSDEWNKGTTVNCPMLPKVWDSKKCCTFSASFVSSNNRFCRRAGTAFAELQTVCHVFPGIFIRSLSWPFLPNGSRSSVSSSIQSLKDTQASHREIIWRQLWLTLDCTIWWNRQASPSGSLL